MTVEKSGRPVVVGVDRQDWAEAARRSLTEAVSPWRTAFPEVRSTSG